MKMTFAKLGCLALATLLVPLAARAQMGNSCNAQNLVITREISGSLNSDPAINVWAGDFESQFSCISGELSNCRICIKTFVERLENCGGTACWIMVSGSESYQKTAAQPCGAGYTATTTVVANIPHDGGTYRIKARIAQSPGNNSCDGLSSGAWLDTTVSAQFVAHWP